jgi:hypothetical protein
MGVQWTELIELLRHYHRVLALDFHGCGRTARGPAGRTDPAHVPGNPFISQRSNPKLRLLRPAIVFGDAF